MIEFGRDICGDAENALRREWLVTNGLGSYAGGTLAGANTRSYHGVLIAALAAPVGRTLLVAKIDATAHLRGAAYKLDTNEWADGSIEPPAYKLIESFRLEGTIPAWTYALNEAQLVKRIWMAHGHHTTYLTYTHARGADPIELDLKALITYRDHHASTQGDWTPAVTHSPTTLQVEMFDQVPPYFVKIERGGTYTPIKRWYHKFKHRVETERGLDDVEDLYAAGQFHVTLRPGETIAVVASTEEAASLDWSAALTAEQQRQRALIEQSGLGTEPAWIQQLVLAADQFIVDRAFGAEIGKSVIAGYHWFGDWGRDTMIALPGLCLTTKRYDVAKTILRTFAAYVDQGMLPNRFPDQGEKPEYNTIDATLWYFHAIDQVVNATHDWALVRELYPVLQDIIAWHVKGTRYNIHVDRDGLLYGGNPTVQLTWMDAKVDDWVVTPRTGKPVEINALWIHALRILARFAQQLGDDAHAQIYLERANQAATSFAQRFWYAEGGYLYDVIDGPDGNDATLRPNQLLALSLTPGAPALLSHEAAVSVLNVCAKELVTAFGLRSLAPTHAEYAGIFTGDRLARDSAYHQGTVWSWLIGPFVEAHYAVFKDRAAAWSYLASFEQHLRDACVGSISEVLDGDAPHRPKGCAAQAWSVAEVLRLWALLTTAPQPAADQPKRQPTPAVNDAPGLLSELADLRSAVEKLRRQNADLLAFRQALEADQRRYREVFDLAPDGYVLTDLNGIISDANRTAAALLSVRQDFLIGKSLWGFIDEAAQASLAAQIAQWQPAGPDQPRPLSAILRGQLQLRVYKGAAFPADFALSPARDEQGRLTGLRWILRDLSESTRTAQALRESEYHYRTLFDNASDAIFIHNLTGRYLEVNRVACESLGYTRDELLCMTPADINAPELVKEIPDRIARLQQADHIFFETTYIRRDGTPVSVELNSRMIEYAGGPAVLSIARDITKRKHVEAALRESNAYLENLIDYANAPIIVWDQQFRITRFNHAFEFLTGRREAEVVGQSLEMLFPPALAEDSMALIRKTLAGERWETVEITIRHRDESVRTLLWNSATLFAPDGQTPIATIAQGQDITARKQAEDELLQQKNLLDTIIESASEAIFAKDTAGRYHAVNESGARMLGYRAVDVIGHTDMELLPAELAGEFRKTDEYVMSSGQVYEREEIGVIDGVTCTFLAHKTPWRDNSGKMVGVIGVSNDITARKRAEEVLTRRAVQLALLSDIGRQIAAILSLDQVLDRAAHLVQESFDYHHVALFLLDHDQGEFVMKAIAGNFIPLFPLNHHIQLDSGMVGWVGAHGERLVANDVRLEPHYINFDPAVIPTCSELSVPIRVGEQTVGVLDVQSPVFDDFDEHDVKVIETLADQIAVAIANARLYEAAQHRQTSDE